jgi:hypothetical protein
MKTHLHGTGIEMEVEFFATNKINKTKRTSTHARKWENFVKTCSNTTSAICGVNLNTRDWNFMETNGESGMSYKSSLS